MESMTRLKGEQAVSYLYEMFKRNDDDVKMSTKTDNMDTIVTVIKTHDDLDAFTQDFESDIFEKISSYKSDNVVTIIAEQSQKMDDNSSRALVYDDITLKIMQIRYLEISIHGILKKIPI